MRKTAIIDLDGTLIRGNSFTLFVKYCVRTFPHVAPRILARVVRRKLRLISHFEAKQRIMQTVTPLLTDENLLPFLEQLRQRVRPMFGSIPDGRSSTCYLATAAPCEYAVPFGRMLGFDHVCSTDCSTGTECRGKDKVASLEAAGVKFDGNVCVYTDHRDDLPLLKANRHGVNYLVMPKASTISEALQAGIRCSVIPG